MKALPCQLPPVATDALLHRQLKVNLEKRLKGIEAIKDGDIDDSDVPEVDERFWRRAERQVSGPIDDVKRFCVSHPPDG